MRLHDIICLVWYSQGTLVYSVCDIEDAWTLHKHVYKPFMRACIIRVYTDGENPHKIDEDNLR